MLFALTWRLFSGLSDPLVFTGVNKASTTREPAK